MLRLPADPWPLLDYFFAYTQCWFPIIERQDVLRTIHLSSEQPVGLFDDALPAHLFELWAIMALASVQKKASAGKSMSLSDSSNSTSHAHDELCDRLITLVPLTGQEGLEVSHVRAILLLAIAEIERQHWSTAWLLVGHASRVAVDLGLHEIQASSHEASSALPSKRTKHVMLGCFVLDAAISFKLRRSPCLQSSHVVPVGLLTEDGLEEWHTWEGLYSEDRCRAPCRVPQRSLSIYNALVELMHVLDQSITPGDAHASNFEGPNFNFLDAMTSWQEKLPAHIDFGAIKSGKAHPTPQLLSLYYIQNYLVANFCNNNQREQLVNGFFQTRQVYADFLEKITLSPIIKCFLKPEDKLSDLYDPLPAPMRQTCVAGQGLQNLRDQDISTSKNENGLGNVSGVQNLPHAHCANSDIHMEQGPSLFAQSSTVNDHSPSTMNHLNVQEQLRGPIVVPFSRPPFGYNPGTLQSSSHNVSRTPRPSFHTASTGCVGATPILANEVMDCNSSMPSIVDEAMNYSMSMPAAHDMDLFDNLEYLERANEHHSQQLFMQNLGLAPGVEMVDLPWDIIN
ncbi:hypothetical protein MMC10_001000 [Thelotrema lepadinum]|nr:hypothetical protein [Thelotrema lepadinum]